MKAKNSSHLNINRGFFRHKSTSVILLHKVKRTILILRIIRKHKHMRRITIDTIFIRARIMTPIIIHIHYQNTRINMPSSRVATTGFLNLRRSIVKEPHRRRDRIRCVTIIEAAIAFVGDNLVQCPHSIYQTILYFIIIIIS